MKILGKYTRIDKVILKCDGDIYDSYLLTGEGVLKEHEIDLSSDFAFNELDVIFRQPARELDNLSDLIEFFKVYNIGHYPAPNGILVGGSKDMFINKDLEYSWTSD